MLEYSNIFKYLSHSDSAAHPCLSTDNLQKKNIGAVCLPFLYHLTIVATQRKNLNERI